MRASIILAAGVTLAIAFSVSAEQKHIPFTAEVDSVGKAHTYGANGKERWWGIEPKPTTLKQALAEDREYDGPGNAGTTVGGKLCAVLKSVKLGCDYGTRMTLTYFLAANGKGLFPTSKDSDTDIGNGYTGQALQQNVLSNAIESNEALFHNGDLSAKDVRERWR